RPAQILRERLEPAGRNDAWRERRLVGRQVEVDSRDILDAAPFAATGVEPDLVFLNRSAHAGANVPDLPDRASVEQTPRLQIGVDVAGSLERRLASLAGEGCREGVAAVLGH